MIREWIFHLSQAGELMSWIVEAAYGRSYGIARYAAQAWFDQSVHDPYRKNYPPQGQYVIEIDARGKLPRLGRDELYFDAQYYSTRQHHNELTWLTQWQALPFEVPVEVCNLVTTTLHRRLTEAGYLIPMSDWEEKYPDQADYRRQFMEMMKNKG